MEPELNAILATQQVPANLSIAYTDMHPLWGGCMHTVGGDGRLERRVRAQGAAEPLSGTQRISERELLDLVRLLVELSAWEQRTADCLPVPDESRAYLTISLEGKSNEIWEWYNEMRANNRLVRIKAWLEGQFGDDPSDVSAD
jgi:hypothetical protein